MNTKLAESIGCLSFVKGFKSLKGNTRTSVVYEIAFGISYVLYNFYLSLYMKAQGVTDQQLGFLISLGFLSGTVCAVFGGFITNRLGRKKTTTVFELIAWPGSVLLYLLADNFWLFALARIVNGASQIALVSWNLMILEDANDSQRMHAFNFMTLINMSLGIITPVGGVIVDAFGIVNAERGFLIFAAVVMITSMTLRNRAYTETSVGRKILEENERVPIGEALRGILHLESLRTVFSRPAVTVTIAAMLLNTVFFTIGSHLSLYFAVYFTEVLQFDQAAVSVLGGLNSAVLLMVVIFVNPAISKAVSGVKSMAEALIASNGLKIAYCIMAIVMPKNSFLIAAAAIALYGVGNGIGGAYSDTIIASVTEDIKEDRAGLYAINYTLSSILSMAIGSVSGYLYAINPHSIYILSVMILLISALLLMVLIRLSKRGKPA